MPDTADMAHAPATRATMPAPRIGFAGGAWASTLLILGSGIIVAALAALPAIAGRALLQDLFSVFIMAALAQYWNLLAGYAGLVSVGQQAFVGIGGYALFAAIVFAGLDPVLAILAGGVAAAVLAVPTALVTFRLKGAYFAIGTWVAAEVFRLTAAQIKPLGGGTGTALPVEATRAMPGTELIAALFHVRAAAARDILTYWLALILAAGSIAAITLLMRSRGGLALSAMRDSEAAAQSVGVDTVRTKFLVFVGTAFGTGLVGGLAYLQKARISPDAAFAVLDWTAYVIVVVIIGGIGTIEGPIIGAIVFYLLQDYLSGFGTWYLILLGTVAIVVMMVAPGGLWGTLTGRYGLHVFPIRRELRMRDE